MGKIYGFGDSFTEGQPMDCTFPPFVKWKELRGGSLPKGWIEILGEKLNMEVVNHGRGGNSNQQIFDDLCNNSHLFETGDIVFLNWTYKDRFRWASWERHTNGEFIHRDENGNYTDYFRRLSSNNDNPEDFKYITKSTKDDIVQNRISKLYSLELYSYENLIEQYAKSKGFELFFWSTDNDVINNLPKNKRTIKKYICADMITPGEYTKRHHAGHLMSHIQMLGGKTISEETNELVIDHIHFGESGHRIQADLFYEHIIKYR